MDFHAFENVKVARVMMSLLQGEEENEQSKSYNIGDLRMKKESVKDNMEVGTFGLKLKDLIDSCDGYGLNTSKSSKGSWPYFRYC